MLFNSKRYKITFYLALILPLLIYSLFLTAKNINTWYYLIITGIITFLLSYLFCKYNRRKKIIIESIQNAIFFFLIPVIAYKNKVKLKNFLFNFKDMKLAWIRFLYFSLILVWFNKVFTTLVYDLYNNAFFYLKSIVIFFL